MPEIKLFGLGQRSKSPNLTAQHRLNLYLETQLDADKASIAAYGTPGLNLFSSPSGQITRGLHWMETVNLLFVVQRGNLYSVNQSGFVTTIGNLSLTPVLDIAGHVSMANNGTELCIVSGVSAYIYNTSTGAWADIKNNVNLLTNAAAGLTDPIPYNADTVTFLDGRFIVNRPATGQFFISALYDGTSWNALDFATAESNPDNLQAVVADKGNLVLFGTSSTEIWGNSGELLFPFARVNGAPSAGGLAARWSLATCKGLQTGLFRNRQGALAVAQLDGYTLNPISTPDIDYLFNNYTSPTDAVGFGYTLNGRSFYQITFQAEDKSWLYDFQSGAWSQLKSWGIARHRGDLCAAFDTLLIVSDYQSGQLYTLDADALTDNGEPIERELTSGHVFMPSRNKMTIRRLRVDMEGGTGIISGQGSNPQIMLKVSRDGGHTWGGELWTTFGKIGEFMSRAEWRRLGVARDWVFNLRTTDPVKVVIINAVIEATELEK
jgi:hypothetical protein